MPITREDLIHDVEIGEKFYTIGHWEITFEVIFNVGYNHGGRIPDFRHVNIDICIAFKWQIWYNIIKKSDVGIA